MMEPLAFLVAILGVGGVGYILRTVLRSNAVMAAAQSESIEHLAAAIDRMSENFVVEQRLTRQLISEQRREVFEGHRRLGQLLTQIPGAKTVGKAIVETFEGVET